MFSNEIVYNNTWREGYQTVIYNTMAASVPLPN